MASLEAVVPRVTAYDSLHDDLALTKSALPQLTEELNCLTGVFARLRLRLWPMIKHFFIIALDYLYNFQHCALYDPCKWRTDNAKERTNSTKYTKSTPAILHPLPDVFCKDLSAH